MCTSVSPSTARGKYCNGNLHHGDTEARRNTKAVDVKEWLTIFLGKGKFSPGEPLKKRYRDLLPGIIRREDQVYRIGRDPSLALGFSETDS
jgi:hypothetical protein